MSMISTGGTEMSDITKKTALSYDGEEIDVSDIPEITDFSSFKRSPRLAKRAAKIKAAGKYYTRAFDFEKGTVEISEIEAGTHRILSVQTLGIDEVAPIGGHDGKTLGNMEWRGSLQDEDVGLRELSRRAMEAQAGT